SHAEIVGFIDEALGSTQGGKFDKAENLLLNKAHPAYDSLVGTVDSLQDAQIKAAEEMREEAETAFKRSRAVILGAIFAGIAIAAVFGFLLVRSIGETLSAAVGVADRIANGHLGNDIRATSDDELGQLLNSLQRMDAKLVDIVGSVRSSSGAVGSAA